MRSAQKSTTKTPRPPMQLLDKSLPLVLIVDDNIDHRAITSVCLHEAGYRVAEAISGPDALDKAAKLDPDLILMDISMPGMSGWEATELLHLSPTTRDIPIIAVTALPQQDVVDAAFDAGCDGFLIKPCRPELLISTVRAHLRPRRQK